MKAGDKQTAEHHGLQARIASWRPDAKSLDPSQAQPSEPELELAKPKPRTIKLPGKFPHMPWKKKPPVTAEPESRKEGPATGGDTEAH